MHFPICRFKDLDPNLKVEWLIPYVLPRNSLIALTGHPEAGKSFLALDWALCLAAGRPWLDLPATKGKTLYVFSEGESGYRQRCDSWAETFEELPDDAYCLPTVLDLTGKDDVKHLLKDIDELDLAPNLIIIDTLAQNFGEGDENKTDSMNAFLRNCRALRQAFPGSSILIVHHLGKQADKGSRGSSAFRAALDLEMLLTDDHELLCKKWKEGPKFIPFKLRLKITGDSCIIEPKEGRKDALNTEDRVMAALENSCKKTLDALSTEDWRREAAVVSVPSRTFYEAKKRLESKGKVRKNGKGWWPSCEP